MAETPFELEFYEDANGASPALRWIKEELTPMQRRAIGVAMHEVLAHEGMDVCESDFGKNLGGGLCEFRVRHDADEILARKGQLRRTVDRISGRSERILLRVFFHPHGDKLILLLGGYDKGRFPSKTRQAKEIATARQRLAAWRQQDAND
jgi:hypothetical protein